MSGSGLHEGIIAFSHTVGYIENRILTSVIYMPYNLLLQAHLLYLDISNLMLPHHALSPFCRATAVTIISQTDSHANTVSLFVTLSRSAYSVTGYSASVKPGKELRNKHTMSHQCHTI